MFCFDENKSYRMPVLFGGSDYDPTYEATSFDALIVGFVQTSTKEALSKYLPKGFSLLEPTITFQYLQLREVNFLAGGAYNILQASLPVHFEGKINSLDGILPLVIWENNTIPILGGREESGMPKIFVDIDDINIVDGLYFSNVSFNGNTFFTFEMNNLIPYDDCQLACLKELYSNVNSIGIRYIPHVGGPGADLIQTILYPQGIVPYEAYCGKGSFNWTNLPLYRGLVHSNIIEQLSSLPSLSLSDPLLIKGKVIMKSPLCRVIS